VESPERQSGIVRILGVSPEQERRLLELFGEKLRNQEFHWYEREKDPEEVEIIESVLSLLPQFVERFGGVPVKAISLEAIHLIDTAKLSADQQEALTKSRELGWYLTGTQEVIVLPDASSHLLTAQRIVHELLHLESFSSFETSGELLGSDDTRELVAEEKLVPRRIGMSVLDKTASKRYFKDLEEAVIEELVGRFDSEYFAGIESLRTEYELRGQFLREYAEDANIDLAAVVERQLPNRAWEVVAQPYLYPEERKLLGALIRRLFDKDPKQFHSLEDVFRIFTDATFTGKLLPLGRLIEETLGKGALRQIAEDTKQER
jgi:hypothetical protein